MKTDTMSRVTNLLAAKRAEADLITAQPAPPIPGIETPAENDAPGAAAAEPAAAGDTTADPAAGEPTPAEPSILRARRGRPPKNAKPAAEQRKNVMNLPGLQTRKTPHQLRVRIPASLYHQVKAVAIAGDYNVREVVVYLIERGISSLPKNFPGRNQP